MHLIRYSVNNSNMFKTLSPLIATMSAKERAQKVIDATDTDCKRLFSTAKHVTKTPEQLAILRNKIMRLHLHYFDVTYSNVWDLEDGILQEPENQKTPRRSSRSKGKKPM